MYKWLYKTPNEFSNIILNSDDGEYLTALCFENSKDKSKIDYDAKEEFILVFKETCKWLDIYFSGKNPNFDLKYKVKNLTPFRKEVYDLLLKIPYGKVITYGEIAQILAKNRNIDKMSSQAVGGAVGANPICLIIPCHRVVGKDGSLVGYGGGINNKYHLLKIENNDMNNFYIPKKGTAL